MLALSSSHRGVRLHTFEPEDRAYTSTPTKIGGHALDHVVGVTLAWSRSLNKRKTTGANRSRNSNRVQCQSERAPVASEAGEAVACSTTLEPSIGRFGGLSVVVHSPRRHLRNEPPPPPAAVFMSPPLCPALAVLPPDTLAPRNITTDADVCPWRQRRHQEFGPWTNEHCNMAEVDPAVIAPLDGSTNVASIIAARSGASGRAAPYRDMATAATGHSGALMAILLFKLANGGLSSSDSTLDTAAAATSSPPQPAAASAAASAAALPSRTEFLHRTVDTVARGLDSIVGVDPAVPVASGGASGGSWAWKARVDQTPQYSKLRKYDFVRELGSGSHGTIFLVRKRPAGTTAARAPSISDGALDANKHGRTSSGGGGTRRMDGNVGSDGHSAVKGSSSSSSSSRDPGGISRGSPGGLRVLKESSFLPEAVNEARLLLLAAGDSVAVADDPGSRVRTGGGFGTDAGGGGVGIGCGVTASSRGGDGVRSYQRGEVVQLHDFFVETLGHRALAFLELEYCEGGDLRGLILGGRAERPAAAAATAAVATFAAEGRGGEAPSVPGRDGTVHTGSSDGGGGGSAQGWERTESGLAAAAAAAARAGEMSGLPAAQIGRVALGLSEGLQRLHERGVLHRDLKPANVLLTKSGAVRVADLGVSTCVDPTRPMTENAAGTVPFMAPEVRKFLLGSKVSYSGKADVWALGALVYAMAVGDPAPEALATQPRARLVSDVGRQTGSEALALVAHRALDPDPSRRPSAHQMTSMLRDCCEREGWLARSSQGSRRAAPMARL